ncbi:hypothetical protein LMG18090_04061 [Ralstonia mannitolilytica]|uniref:hypothetical protein n=1 Tax=Ralstonia mannitolilytica TaxID=105219 RepID=UPI0007B01C32|nr:hypothetical protein [Ralstonia mannitolilytica]ANA34481.1 hypothetical protein VZ52_14385 [Ralstonia mannitolilytica]CAJ0800894.1 hypothetical protein LMG18090_04061 [Ralstonia mannitolilytica]
MSLLDPRVWCAVLLALAAAFGVGYYKGDRAGAAAERAKQAQAVEDWQTNAEAATELYLEARDQKEIEYRTITKTVEVAKNATPDIPDCRTGDDWMRIYRDNAAIANGASAVPAGAGNSAGPDAR